MTSRIAIRWLVLSHGQKDVPWLTTQECMLECPESLAGLRTSSKPTDQVCIKLSMIGRGDYFSTFVTTFYWHGCIEMCSIIPQCLKLASEWMPGHHLLIYHIQKVRHKLSQLSRNNSTHLCTVWLKRIANKKLKLNVGCIGLHQPGQTFIALYSISWMLSYRTQ